jgi:hypothetical protein
MSFDFKGLMLQNAVFLMMWAICTVQYIFYSKNFVQTLSMEVSVIQIFAKQKFLYRLCGSGFGSKRIKSGTLSQKVVACAYCKT